MGYQKAWLDYEKLEDGSQWRYGALVYANSEDRVIQRAVEELQIALKAMCDLDVCAKTLTPALAETVQEGILLHLTVDESLGNEGFRLQQKNDAIYIMGNAPSGILYGVFHLLRLLRTGVSLYDIDVRIVPEVQLRMLNHWDNMDGSIERGYSGKSFFFENNEVVINDRTQFYCRMLASIGINGAVINNVNVKHAATALIGDRYREKVSQLATLFASYGIKLYLSINFAAPMELGTLTTADPCDDGVIAWWKDQSQALFTSVPDIGGYLVKADSEGRPGPFTYNRNHADGANMLAKSIAPYGGIVIWRCFVYNCQQDWRDLKTDRARSAYDNFLPLDGQFDSNVILQIKNGPMDFQVREPVSPLLGALKASNRIIEFQIAQEYTGQQRHICYLIPMFKEILAFRTHCKPQNDTIGDIVSGKTFLQSHFGMAAVTNTGNDENWTGHDMAAANLYGFGRMCFDMTLNAEEIAAEWIQQTFGNDGDIQKGVGKILMMSWPAYEKYTSPLGIGWMVNPNHHYGPSVDGYEYDRWGTYHRADHKGIGVDRSTKGTGYAALYHEPMASIYETIDTCPEELLLFFHHVPYNHVLSTGKTVIQHIYDTHFEGVEDVEEMIRIWRELEMIMNKRYTSISERLDIQLTSAMEWRDVVNSYFFRKTGIPDEQNRRIY